jgi:hypothetical protein
MEKDVSGELSGAFGQLFQKIASGGRDQSRNVDTNLASKEANDLFKVSF